MWVALQQDVVVVFPQTNNSNDLPSKCMRQTPRKEVRKDDMANNEVHLS